MGHYPKAYIDYLLEFHATRDYFECHEIMEEFWKENTEKHWLAFIQLAVAIYHERQNNFSGSLKLYRKVLSYLQEDKTIFQRYGIDAETLEKLILERLENMKQGNMYTTFNLPITDNRLLEECKALCKERSITWGNEEDLSDETLIFRHKLRDRSDVIQERKISLEQRKRERKG